MKITQIMLAEEFGGAERSFVDASVALANRGHEVLAICHRKFIRQNLLKDIPGVQLEVVDARGEWDFIAPRKIGSLIHQFGSDIVHTQMKRAAWHGGRGAHRVGVPVVAKLHNYVKLKRYCYVDTLIGTTEDQRNHALELNWPADRVRVIPNFSRVPPVDISRIPSSKPLRLLTYGRCVHKKGFDVLIRAMKVLVDRGVDVRLTIGGIGPEEEALSLLAEELGLSDRVSLGVWIDDIVSALDEVDVFVLPSRDEPFGIVMLEAMARGLPIVTTRTQGPSQVLSDATAWFAEIDSVESLLEALQQVVDNPEQAAERASKALELYRTTYHEDAVLPQLEELYCSVISRHKTSC